MGRAWRWCCNSRNNCSRSKTAWWYCIYREVPDKGKKIEAGNEAAVVESVKAASDVYSPIGGEVVETNSSIVSDPSLVNKDPENAGWFFKIKVTNKSEVDTLMNKNDYEKYATENPN